MSGQWPWGSGPAPALHCDGCGRRLGKQAGHFITETRHLVCGTCLFSTDDRGRRLHAKFHPDCVNACRGLLDHRTSSATRAAAWFVLTKPKERSDPEQPGGRCSRPTAKGTPCSRQVAYRGEACLQHLGIDLAEHTVTCPHCRTTIDDVTVLGGWCVECKRPVLLGRQSDHGTQIDVWCAHCGREHYHGRHDPRTNCRFNGLSGICTCPPGSGDGHRVAHCHDDQSPYDRAGYIVVEIR